MWLKEGNKNTYSFHVRSSHRNKKNWIEGICNDECDRVKGTRIVCMVAKEYFQSLFKTEVSSDTDRVINCISTCFTTE